MKYLNGKEKKDADLYMKFALEEAVKSNFEGLHKGAVIVSGTNIIGWGHNEDNPYSLHTKQNAIISAYQNGHSDLKGGILYSIQEKDGEKIFSNSPNCLECSKLIISSGINKIVLFHKEGYGSYSAKEFYDLSLEKRL